MHGVGQVSDNLSTMAAENLLEIAVSGPRPQEERWRDRQLQDLYQDLAQLDARCNALAELVRRSHAGQVAVPLPLGGHRIAPHGGTYGEAMTRPADAAGGEVDAMCADAIAKLLHEASATLLRIADSLAARTAPA